MKTNPERQIACSVPGAWKRAIRGLPLWAASFLSLNGCMVHEVDVNPRPEVNLSAGIGEGRYVHGPYDAKPVCPLGNPWWCAFADGELSSLVEKALCANPDLKSIRERIYQANARVVQAGSTLFPQVDGNGEFQHRWNVGGNTSSGAELGLTVDWELDLWGRIRYGRNARIREAEAIRHDWESARLDLTAILVESWFVLLEQQGQLRLAREQIELGETLLELTQLRFGQGQSSVVAVYQQREQLQSVLSRVPDIEARIELIGLVVDGLAGDVPGRGGVRPSREAELPTPPPFPRTGVPGDLLAGRPDLRAQRARIVALDHEVGEAIADRLPGVSIGGSLALAGAPTLDSLVGDLIAGAVGPILDAGNREAEVMRRESRVRGEVNRYTALFLSAAGEVEAALVGEEKIAERIRRQQDQLITARKLLEESRNRYQRGLTDYLPVLDAVSRVQELEQDILFSRFERLSARIDLHQALGGPMPTKR